MKPFVNKVRHKNMPFHAGNKWRRRFVAAMCGIFLGVSGAGAAVAETKLLVFGDSLVAGYRLPLDQAFPAQLERKLKADGHDVKVINAGVSGDTTSGGLSRLEWTLKDKPDIAILELGANDMLRATDPAVTRENLDKMLDIFKKNDIPVLLAGMKPFRNLGTDFADSYNRMFKDLSVKYDVVYYPFFLDGVAFDAKLNLDDGMHPNEKGVAAIVNNIYDEVLELLEKKAG